jgi:hypothetical protein
MKKTSKPASTKAVAKRPAVKKSSSKPKSRKAAGQGDLTQVIERLSQIADRLADTADRLGEAVARIPGMQEIEQELEGAGEVVGVMVVDESEQE